MTFKKGNSVWAGKKRDQATKDKISASLMGKKKTVATKGKMSTAKQGAKNPVWKGGLSKNKQYTSWSKNLWGKRKKEATGKHTYLQWEEVKARYNWTCPACKKREPEIKLTQDHIVPLSKGGSDNIENIQPLCRTCNCKKATNVVTY